MITNFNEIDLSHIIQCKSYTSHIPLYQLKFTKVETKNISFLYLNNMK